MNPTPAQVPTCPCGYITECSIWCGEGHMNGQCPPFPADSKGLESATFKPAEPSAELGGRK